MLMSDRTSWVSSNLGLIQTWASYTVFKRFLTWYWSTFDIPLWNNASCYMQSIASVAYNTDYLMQRSHIHHAKLLKCLTLEWQLCPSKPEAWPLIHCLWNKHPLPHREEKCVFLDSIWFWEMYASNVMNSSMLYMPNFITSPLK